MSKVRVSSVIAAPVDRVWAKIRDFNALPQWHPLITTSRIEGGRSGDSVGAVRDFVLKPDARLKEKLLALSDVEHFVTYSIVEAPVPVKNYIATLRLREITDGSATFAEWSAEFVVPAEQEADTIALVSTVFQSGLDGLKKQFIS